ncbi:MAG: hypothetical protein ACREBS_05290 [Nitrososphaerales archaeon]
MHPPSRLCTKASECSLQLFILPRLQTYWKIIYLWRGAAQIEKALCFRDTIEIEAVSRLDCSQALTEAEEQHIGFIDAIAYVLMKKKGLREIYSFYTDFDRVPEIKRIRK